MSEKTYFLCATVLLIMSLHAGRAQTAQPVVTAPVTSQAQSALQTYQQEQQALAQEEQTLINQGATQEEITTWHQQNAARFNAQIQRAQAMSTASSTQSLPTNVQVNIPANASPAMKDFLTNQALLANARVQIHNQLVQSLPANATADQVEQAQQQEEAVFQQQYGQAMALQTKRAQAVAAESAQSFGALPAPPPIPTGTSPQLAALLTLKYQIASSQAQILKSYATADPAVRQAALQQWSKQNAVLLQQLQQQAENLSEAGQTIQTN